MAEYWQINIGDWNAATDSLTLEQEAALLRVINATRSYDRPLKVNLRVLNGLWRCNTRKSERLLADLVAAGVVRLEDGLIINRRAVEEALTFREVRVKSQSTGREGGIASGKARRKPLKNNEQDEGPPSTRREEKRREDIGGGRARKIVIGEDARRQLFEAIGAHPVTGEMPRSGFTLGSVNDFLELDLWQTDLGLSLDQVAAVCSDVMAKNDPDNDPRTFKFFTPAMERASAQFSRHQTTGSGNGKPRRNDRPITDPAGQAIAGLTRGFQRVVDQDARGGSPDGADTDCGQTTSDDG